MPSWSRLRMTLSCTFRARFYAQPLVVLVALPPNFAYPSWCFSVVFVLFCVVLCCFLGVFLLFSIACATSSQPPFHLLLRLFRLGQTRWMREEGLASIANVQYTDLPPKHHVADLEPTSNIVSQFLWRIKNDIDGLKDFVSDVVQLTPEDEAHDHHHGLSRDNFNQRHIIVAVTKAGKLFGVDSKNGKVCSCCLCLSVCLSIYQWKQSCLIAISCCHDFNVRKLVVP
jgi:hypothetical protein